MYAKAMHGLVTPTSAIRWWLSRGVPLCVLILAIACVATALMLVVSLTQAVDGEIAPASVLLGSPAGPDVPPDVVAAPPHRPSAFVAAGGGAVLVLAIGLALFAGSRLDRPYRRLMARSEARFRVMADTIPSIVFITRSDGWCEYVNRRFCDYAGIPMNEAVGFGWTAALHPEDKERVSAGLMEPPGEDDLQLSEVRIRNSAGSYRWFLVRKTPMRDDAGRIVKWFGSLTDVDDFKTAEATARRVNARLTAVLASIDECYCTVDHDLRLTYVNPNAAAWVGEEPDQLVGRLVCDVVPGLNGPDFTGPVRIALEKRTPFQLERASTLRRGHWLEIHCYPWADGLSFFFRDITRRKSAEKSLQGAQELLQGTMDALSAHIAVVDEKGVIVAANAAWRHFEKQHAIASYAVGCSALEACRAVTSEADFVQMARGVRAVIEGEERDFRMQYPCRIPGTFRWFQMHARRFAPELRRVVIAHEDVSDIKQAEAELRDLTSRLLGVQDEERRRMARDLHDTTAQNLVAALMDIDRVQRMALTHGEIIGPLIKDARALVDQSLQEIRTLSYLLHPPLLEELGLAHALKWLVRGFERRSGITVSLNVQEGLERMPWSVESALFRVVQEALTNIHRHSGSAMAAVTLTQSARRIILEVSDEGTGLVEGVGFDGSNDVATLGVGISGMRARLHQLGGELKIRSRRRGAAVTATVPVDTLLVGAGGSILRSQARPVP